MRDKTEEVESRKDEELRTLVLEIDGNVTASNSIILPSSSVQSLTLTGRIIYFLIRPDDKKGFVINIDLKTADGLAATRVSISNTYKETKATKLFIQLPLTTSRREPGWTLIKFNISELGSILDTDFQVVTRIQLCSTLRVAGILTSDMNYSLVPEKEPDSESLRRQMRYSFPKDFLPSSIGLNKTRGIKSLEEIDMCLLPESTQLVLNGGKSTSSNMTEQSKNGGKHSVVSPSEEASCGKLQQNGILVNDANDLEHSPSSDIIRREESWKTLSPQSDRKICSVGDTEVPVLKGNVPGELDLSHVTACSRACSSIVLIASGKVIVFPSETNVVMMDVVTKMQCHLVGDSPLTLVWISREEQTYRCFGIHDIFYTYHVNEFLYTVWLPEMEPRVAKCLELNGHTSAITCLALDPDARILVSCQEVVQDSFEPNVALIQLWRIPDWHRRPRHDEFPIGTCRARSVGTIDGVSLSNRGEFLLAYGEDVNGRGVVLVWDARVILVNSNIPLLARSSTDNHLTGICLLPPLSDGEMNEIKPSNVALRFVTVSGSRGNKRSEPPVPPGKTVYNQAGTIRLWRLRIGTISDGVRRSSNRGHLSSSPLNLSHWMPNTELSQLDFTDCCPLPVCRSSHRTEVGHWDSVRPSWSVVACSSSGHIVQFNPDNFEVASLHRMSNQSSEESDGKQAVKLIRIPNDGSKLRLKNISLGAGTSSAQMNANLFVHLTCIRWIQCGPGTLDGWLATGSSDGCFRLWQLPNAEEEEESPTLEVTYPGPINAMTSQQLLPERMDAPMSEHVTLWISKSVVGVCTRTGGLACLTLSAESGDKRDESGGGLRLVDCVPRRLLAWQTDGPIVCVDIIAGDASNHVSIVATASAGGSIRIWKMEPTSHEYDAEVGGTDSGLIHCFIEDTPLFDLGVCGMAPCYIALQPMKSPWPTFDCHTENDYTWLRLVCGYSESGLVRVFSPAAAQVVQEMTHHKGYDIAALQFSTSGHFLFTVDSSGQLAKLSDSNSESIHTKGTTTFQLSRSLSRQIAIYSHQTQTESSSCNSSAVSRAVLSIDKSDRVLAYIGPGRNQLTLADCATLNTLVLLEMDQLDRTCFSTMPDPHSIFADYRKSSAIPLLRFISSAGMSVCDLLVSTAGGHLIRLDAINGRVKSCAKLSLDSPNNPTDSEDTENLAHNVQWSSIAISPDGLHCILADASKPIVYTTSTRLCPLESSRSNTSYPPKHSNYELVHKKFVGHLHPVSMVLWSADQSCCLTVDQGNPSAIIVWKFHSNREDEITDAGDAASVLRVVPQYDIPIGKEEYVEHEQSNQVNEINTISAGDRDQQIWPPFFRHANVTPNPSPKNVDSMTSNLKVLNSGHDMAHSMIEAQKTLEFHSIHANQGSLIHGFIGYSCTEKAITNLIWDPDSGLFVYIMDSYLICECLDTNSQIAFTTVTNQASAPVDHPPYFVGEELTVLALSPNHRHLAVGTRILWDFDKPGRDLIENEPNQFQFFSSSVLLLPVDALQNRPHPARIDTLSTSPIDRQRVVRLSPLLDEKHTLLENHADCMDIHRLKSMAFSANSCHLITADDGQRTNISVWCIRRQTLLTQIELSNFANKVICSTKISTDFVTIGSNSTKEYTDSRSAVGELIFWHLDHTENLIMNKPDPSNGHAAALRAPLSCATFLSYQLNGNSVEPQELLVVATTSGILSLWNSVLRIPLLSHSIGLEEICVLEPCGPAGFVIGSHLGRLSLWRLETGYQSIESFPPAEEKCNLHLRLMKEVSQFHGRQKRPILTASFDPEGQMGVISTANCTAWYVHWSEIEKTSPSPLDISGNSSSGFAPCAGLTRLFGGHTGQIIAMSFWHPDFHPVKPFINMATESKAMNSNPLLITLSSDGMICTWNVLNRELGIHLQATDQSFNHTAARAKVTCMDTLDSSRWACDSTYGSEAVGCLAVGFDNCTVKLFCLHRASMISRSAPLDPKNTDSINQIRFAGPQHLIIGTQQGLLIVIKIIQSRLTGPIKLTVQRQLKQHLSDACGGITNLDIYPDCLRVDQVEKLVAKKKHTNQKPVSRDGHDELWNCAIHSQSNRASLLEDFGSDNTAIWMWLAVSRDQRLSIWLLIDPSGSEFSTTRVNRHIENPVRCQLIRWIRLDKLQSSTLLPKQMAEVSSEFQSKVFNVQFLPFQSSRRNRKAHPSTSSISLDILIGTIANNQTSEIRLYSFMNMDQSSLLSPSELKVAGTLQSLLSNCTHDYTNLNYGNVLLTYALLRQNGIIKLLSIRHSGANLLDADPVVLAEIPSQLYPSHVNSLLTHASLSNNGQLQHFVVIAHSRSLILISDCRSTRNGTVSNESISILPSL